MSIGLISRQIFHVICPAVARIYNKLNDSLSAPMCSRRLTNSNLIMARSCSGAVPPLRLQTDHQRTQFKIISVWRTLLTTIVNIVISRHLRWNTAAALASHPNMPQSRTQQSRESPSFFINIQLIESEHPRHADHSVLKWAPLTGPARVGKWSYIDIQITRIYLENHLWGRCVIASWWRCTPF